MFNACLAGCFYNSRDIYLPSAQYYVIILIGTARVVAGHSFFQIFHMQGFITAAISIQHFSRVLPREESPKDIQFKAYIFWVGVFNDVIIQGASFIRLKFKPMVMVNKTQTVLIFQYFTVSIKIG